MNAGMPNIEEVEDRGSLGNAMGMVAGSWFSNQKKDIVRVGMYERTKQHHQAWQLACLNNLFENYCRSKSITEATVRTQAGIEKLMRDMFDEYGIHFFWDPDRVDPLADHPCDLLRHCRDQVIRLLLTLALERCEKENDALGLRAWTSRIAQSLHTDVQKPVRQCQVQVWALPHMRHGPRSSSI